MLRAGLVICAIAAAGAACGKEKSKGASSRDGVVAAWKKGGLEPGELKPAKVDFGKDCASGTVSKLDVLVCTFPNAQDAKAAEDAGFAWIGDATGVSKAQGEMLIVVADRKKADVSGKTITQLIELPAN